MKPVDILDYIDGIFSRSQAIGLNFLIFRALREQTTVDHQRKESGFADIPERITLWCDRLEDEDLLGLAKQITDNLLEDEFVGREMNAKINESHTGQDIETDNKPALLSDY